MCIKKCRDDVHIVATINNFPIEFQLFHIHPHALAMCSKLRCVHTLY